MKSVVPRGLRLFFFCCLCVILIWKSPLKSQERFRRSPPYPDPLPELKLPNIESFRLSNDLTISVIRRENFPVISMHLIVLTGESSSPEDYPGLASFTTNMLSKGTLDLASSEIEERIESIGGNFSSVTYPDYSIFSFSFLDEYLEEAIEILSKMLLEPAFARREIDNVKRTMFYDMVTKNSNPEIVAEKLLFQILFRDHTYEKITYNDDVIKNLNRDALVSFFDKFYRPNNAKLVLIGDLNFSTASRYISRYFNTWEKKDLENSLLEPPLPNTEQKICLADIPNAKDATIYVGNVIAPITSKDFFPFLVLNQVLGGTPQSRLFMNLRESKGFAYYAFSAFEFLKACSVFLVKARVRPEVTYDSISGILEELKKISDEKIPNLDIEQAKAYLIGNFPLQIKTFENFALKVSEIHAFNLGEEHWNKYYENIMFINSEYVFETAQKSPLLSSVIIIAGDKNIILDRLSRFKEVEIYDNKGNLQFTVKGKEE